MSNITIQDSDTISLFGETEIQSLSKVTEKEVEGMVSEENSVKVDEVTSIQEENTPSPKLTLSENAIRVLEKRYLIKNEEGKSIETPEKMFRRIAKFISTADKIYDDNADVEYVEEQFYQMMTSLDFLPNSPTLMNAGRKLGQLSACFVLPVEDSMESIFETIKHTALIHKSGGGTGFSFSRIRPNMDIVQSTRGVSSGPISFMTVFDAATEAIKQGGTRRGANMAILRVDHPDIMQFITCKEDNNRLNNFNISVAITEQFMKAVEYDEDYELINPRTRKIFAKLNAKKVFDKIVQMAWKNGDPGIVFIDRINKENPTPKIGEIESTNPCGEQPLLPYESCNLGSINLSLMVADGKINFDKLKKVVRTSVHFLDNIIDKNRFPLKEIENLTKGNRKIGLGIMGFADMLIKLGIPYNSLKAIETAENVMQFISIEANKMSIELAAKRGVFPNFEQSVYFDAGPNYRNATRTTIAPTGTISIIAGCSSGIEPLFALSFVRNVMDNDRLLEVHPLFEETAKKEGFYSKELMNRVAEKGSIQDFKDIPEHIRKVYVTSHDITPEWHVRMQSAFQKYTDNAVSKTVNFPNSAKVDDVKKVYEMAYKMGCKGVTIYRDGSRDVQVLNKGSKNSEVKTEEVIKLSKRNRPALLKGKTIRMNTGCGSMYVTINEDENGPFELFNNIGKAGGCAACQSEAIGRLVSLAWRSGIKSDEVRKELVGISCHKPFGFGAEKTLSCADAIAKAIGSHINMQTSQQDVNYINGGACPECGGQVEHESGCMVCRACGYSECG